jgi:hypothetical protein
MKPTKTPTKKAAKKAVKKKVFKAPPIPDMLEERLINLEKQMKNARRLHFKFGRSNLD